MSEKFTYKKLLRFVLPTILMMLITSIYGVVDGLFVANFVGTNPFAAINFVIPITFAFTAIGLMFGAGGSALVGKTLGEKEEERANKIFSMIIYFLIIVGVILSACLFFSIGGICKLFGASDILLPDCDIYGKIIIIGLVFSMLQCAFQSFLITAGKATFGFIITVICGLCNIALDAVFIVGFKMGTQGAAIATIASQFIGAIIPIIYFANKNNKSYLRLVKTKLEFKPILKSMTNGSSEYLNNISWSIVSIIYNAQLMKLVGENGVAAYGVVMYIAQIFVSISIGYAVGCSPIISYNYGAKNSPEIKSVLRQSIIIALQLGSVMFAISEILAHPLSAIFASGNSEVLSLTETGFRIYAVAFIIFGVNIFTTSFFTGLNNGLLSAILSIVRTLILPIVFVYVLPLIFGLNGIWVAVIFAELFTLPLSIWFICSNKKKYNY